MRQIQFIEQPEPLPGIIQFLIPAPATASVPQNTCYVVADLYPPPSGTTSYGTGDYTSPKLVNQPLATGPPREVTRGGAADVLLDMVQRFDHLFVSTASR